MMLVKVCKAIVLVACASSAAAVGQVRLDPGSGSFELAGGADREEKTITVFYHRPQSFETDSPVVLVIPGAGRNGDDYRDAWIEASERYGVLVLSPSYPERFYPEFWNYNLAGMTEQVTIDLSIVMDTQSNESAFAEAQAEVEQAIGMHELVGQSTAHQLIYQLALFSKAGMISDVDIGDISSVANQDPAQWIFADFDRIFLAAKNGLGLAAETYDLFGHSAGGQILHRLALFHPDSRADRILAANSGWYTIPVFHHAFPYGLQDSGLSEDQLEAAFAAELVVFLGEDDDADETRGSIRRTPQAEHQGPHRLARGKHFFKDGRATAEEMGADFEWKLEIVPGVGHDYERMGEAAAAYLYGR